jgi:hypothetical protein
MTEQKLLTMAEYEKLDAFNKGYASYWFSSWPGSEIPSEEVNPFPEGSADFKDFQRGINAAIIAAQDSEE